MFKVLHGYQEVLKEQKQKDEKINLIEKKQLEAQSNQLLYTIITIV